MAQLDSDGADSEAEWAANILKAIGITPENPDGGMNAGLPENITPPIVCNAPPIIAPPVIGSPLKLPYVKPIRASTKGY